MKKLLYLFLLFLVIKFALFSESSVSHGPGTHAPHEPVQTTITSTKSFKFGDYEITPLAKFQIKAKVLSKKNYYTDRESDLSPIDLALGWGRMSDETIINRFTISQSNRWYFWRTEKFPIPRNEVETHSANMHLIPKDNVIEAKIKNARKGDIIALTGSLVRVDAEDGWHWVSSLTRNDTGGHSCELIFVEDFEIH